MMTRPTLLLVAGLLCGAALLGYGCPTSSPTPPPTTTTTLAPTPPPLCFAPTPGAAGDYAGVETRPAIHTDAVLAAREAIGRYTCWPQRPDTGLELMAAKLREGGLCAVKSEDRVIVGSRSDGLFEEWHLVRYDTGCWASAARAYKGTLAWGAAK
jgi:hypothetical protein